MNKKSGTRKAAATKLVKSIRRKTRQTYTAEEKIQISSRFKQLSLSGTPSFIESHEFSPKQL